ncbi:hypothetical protein EX30DRAFT_84087 [Ascodesmis nigricans]|uniref:Arrestin-like N-terminal domain-containing protein n=1 Tax=Ascodesmis nigricans TaxID=341454 RepID=A0A4V3SJD1_9PEZI|nr:hypothetical protein EX30DRAFT_84087 [Ascodesmis nigricans]
MFTYAESIATSQSKAPTIRQSLKASYARPELSIRLKGDSKNFTTGDAIEGEVIFTTQADIRFDNISITFEGTSRTWMDRLGATPASGSGQTSVTQTVSGGQRSRDSNVKRPFLIEEKFLRLIQPIEESAYPIPRVASGSISFPFTFVVPSHFLPTVCSSKDDNLVVKAAHVQLPPSFGDSPRTDGYDDMAPDMTKISYNIRAQVHRKREDNTKICVISDSQRVHIRPTFEESPPVHVSRNSTDYVLHKEKDLRKGFLGRKIGRFTATAPEPNAMQLSTTSFCPATTTVPIDLTFTPSNLHSVPPPLGSVTTKLRSSTFFSTTHTSYIPTPSTARLDPLVGHYHESTLLSSRNIANTAWTLSTSPTTGRLQYKAQLTLPITEPKGKTLIPSFSTCYISRSYRLEIAISVHTSSHSQPSLTLKVPLQVARPGKNEGGEIHDGEILRDVEAFFTPRSVAPPPGWSAPEARAGRRGMPVREGYSTFGGQVAVLPVRIPSPMGISPGCG